MSNYFPFDPLQYQDHGGQPPQSFGHFAQGELASPTGTDPWLTLENAPPPAQPKSATEAESHPSATKEQVKHRRTRSGCYTCRGRRVKVFHIPQSPLIGHCANAKVKNSAVSRFLGIRSLLQQC